MDYSKLIDFIKELQLPDEEKLFLLSKIQDPMLSEDQRKKIFSDFVNGKERDISNQIETVVAPMIQKARVELDAADHEYTATLDQLDKEADAIADATDKKLDAIQ